MNRGAAAAAALFLVALALTLLGGPWGDERVSDLFVYRTNAEAFLDGLLPYRDVGFEYPPLAAPLMALAGLGGGGEDAYRLSFAALTAGLGVAVVLMCGALARRTGGRPTQAMLAVALLPLLAGAMVRTHFDLAPVALTLAALVLLCDGRSLTGFAVLGLGVMTKLFPLVVVPVALAWLLARGERRAAAHGAAALAAVIAALSALAAALSPSGAWAAVAYHLDRPVQIESLPASALILLDSLGLGEARGVSSFRSDGLLHPASEWLVALQLAVLVGVLATIVLVAATRPFPGGERAGSRVLVLASLTAVLAFAALGKVLSPQFLIWAAPLGALALAWRMRALAASIALATTLTLAEFPSRYFDVVNREPSALLLVGVRNAALLAALVLALRELRTARTPAPAAAGSPSLARPRPPLPEPH